MQSHQLTAAGRLNNFTLLCFCLSSLVLPNDCMAHAQILNVSLLQKHNLVPLELQSHCATRCYHLFNRQLFIQIVAVWARPINTTQGSREARKAETRTEIHIILVSFIPASLVTDRSDHFQMKGDTGRSISLLMTYDLTGILDLHRFIILPEEMTGLQGQLKTIFCQGLR